jgi:WD40 repeat protein
MTFVKTGINIFTFLLILFLMTSCTELNTTYPDMKSITPPGMSMASPTKIESNTPEVSVMVELTPTITPTYLPNITYPLKPGPIITRENATLVALLGTIPEGSMGGVVGSQLAWSPDSSELAVTTCGEGVKIIDPMAMREIGEINQQIEGIVDCPGGIAYSPDGNILAVSIPQGKYSNPGDISFYETSSFTKVRDIPSNGAYALKFSHNGKWLAYGGLMGGEVINIETEEQVYQFDETNIDFDFVLFSWDDNYFTASGNGYSPVLVNTGTWTAEYELDGNICFSLDNKYIAMNPGIWEMGKYQLVKQFETNYFVGLCDFGKQSDILINSESGVGVVIWDVNSGIILNHFLKMIKFSPYYNMALSPDGKLIAVMDRSTKAVSIWGIPSD